MATVVTYDIPSKHVEFKNAMFVLGYKDRISHDNKTIYLPNTTLYHASKDSVGTRKDVQAVSTRLGVNLERCIATQLGPDWAAIWGEPFK